MKIRHSVGAGLVAVALIAAATASANPVLGPQFNYRLNGAPVIPIIVAGGGPSVPNPGVDVSLNPQPLPPFPDPGSSLDLTDPGGPVYTDPGPPGGGTVAFLFSWGMNAGGPVSFTPPTPAPGDPNSLIFSALNANQVAYEVMLTLDGANPGQFVELNPQPLPPFPDPNFSFVSVGILAGADPQLTFHVDYQGTAFAFSSVPEPSTGLLLAAALALFALAQRARRAADRGGDRKR